MPKEKKSVNSITHKEEKRTNIPTAEYENIMNNNEKKPIKLKYPRNPDLDPQLVWRGKDDQDWSDLVITAPPLYIQEKINPKYIIDDLMNQSKKLADNKSQEEAPDLFADMFDGELDPKSKTEFYSHDQNWTNRMILGDSLQVMASLAEREGLRGKVQCVYLDPPYGIKFASNWQVSTLSRNVKDGKADQISREAEMVKAFRDTWSEGIHSYLTYLRDRLTVARDLLNDSGSIFVQIGDENLHRVRALLDEVFGEDNFVSQIAVLKTTGVMATSSGLHGAVDYILWFGKTKTIKFNELFTERSEANSKSFKNFLNKSGIIFSEGELPDIKIDQFEKFRFGDLLKSGPGAKYEFFCEGKLFSPGAKWWGTNKENMERLVKANRVKRYGKFVGFVTKENDFPVQRISNLWTDTTYLGDRYYVVQTGLKIVERCILMTTDPGDLVLDPTCGSGTTAVVAEKFGRRWIAIDTSRVALSLTKTRITTNVMPSFILRDSAEGCRKESEISGKLIANHSGKASIRAGFVYERVGHITPSVISNNKEIDEIYDNHIKKIQNLLNLFNTELNTDFEIFKLPQKPLDTWSEDAINKYQAVCQALAKMYEEMESSVQRACDTKLLYDKPYENTQRVRVTGPFTVESLSPYKVIAVDEDGEFLEKANSVDGLHTPKDPRDDQVDFGNIILEHLRTAGVQQAHKEDRIKFTSINPFPGKFICGDGRYDESKNENSPQKRAAIFIGPEYGTLGRTDIVAAAREARELEFDVLICCAFNYDTHSSEIDSLADLPILKARINPDLHMADELKNTGAGNLFVVFGEPDIEINNVGNDKIQIKINGVDVFHPSKGEVVSGGPESIAAWFIDTNYNEESFFVRHAYFLGANDPYKQLKRALKAEIDEEAWESLYRDISRPFPKPETRRVAVKVINHLGDEVMKVFTID